MYMELKYKYECTCTSMYKQMLILNQKLIVFCVLLTLNYEKLAKQLLPLAVF